MSFSETTVVLIPKLDKNNKKNKFYRVISLINRDAKILNKILVNQVQQYVNSSHTMISLGSFQGHMNGLVLANLSMCYITLKKGNI